MALQDLQHAYTSLGLQAGLPKVLDLLPRLRMASTWHALPVWELQKECRQLGIGAAGNGLTKEQLVRELVLFTWGQKSEQPEETSEDFWKSRAERERNAGLPQSEALQRAAVHFRTLGLSASAGSDELKRAYRKMVLQYHPDKNLGACQAEAAVKFREVSEAYEALCEFMKVKN
eukprot:TRINITY_DN62289_c0_g1_i1.p1 TRINITY_DN62289_c0_g1~~TRINITY_DN62289_c0_g1_i1.p1  ORF type:complete len:174 (+),score=40.00 TRINITY_DN62289_c0_g1_i1:3-524(+)